MTDRRWTVPHALEGERVDRAVALLTGWSRSEVAALLARDEVLVDGSPVAKSRKLVADEVVEVLTAPEVAGPPVAEDIPLRVVYEDDAVAVIDKPAGLVVHPGPGHATGTLVNGLLARFPEIADVGDPMRPGIVHRLDRDTSGLLVVARTELAYEGLVDALTRHEVERHYQALVWGVPASARGVIDAPIGRSVKARMKMSVREGGRASRTAYRVEESFRSPPVARLECALETGRTHQIRVHLAAIHHPVVGDLTYGTRRPALLMDRPFLHAAELAFVQPASGEPLRFTSALPPELAEVLDALRASDARGAGEG